VVAFVTAFVVAFEGAVLPDFLGAFLTAAVFLAFFPGVAEALAAFFPAGFAADVFAEDVLEAEALVLDDIRKVFPLGRSSRFIGTAVCSFVQSGKKKENLTKKVCFVKKMDDLNRFAFL